MKRRAAALESIRDQTFDLCVIGGGATGLGSALDAQLRGLSTLLIDADDFVSKTSSASTKLVHGGVRYLEQAVLGLDYGQFQMVRKGLHERIHMLRAAPYLVHRLELLVPCYSRWQMLYMALGIKMYDLIAGKAHFSPSRILSRQQAMEALPILRMEKVAGAVTYEDGQFNDARYGIAMAQTIAQSGGELLNYARVVGFESSSDGKLRSARVEDRIGGQQFTVSAGIFLNCTGPFADEVRLMANPQMKPRLRISKGIHILLPADALQSETALLIPETEDGRVIFAIPWFGSLLVGTTDDEIEKSEEITATESEIAYLLKYVNQYLSTNFTFSDVQAAFAGVRPLVASKDAVSTKKLVRDHEVETDAKSGLISILGGKWTTYRAMAEDGINHVERALGRPVSAALTRSLPLAGAQGFHAEYWRELVAQYQLPENVARHLAQEFGTDAARVLETIQAEAGLAKPVYPGSAVLAGEVLYCIREEMAQSIEDVLARRTGIQVHSWKNAIAAASPVGELLGREFGWSQEATMKAIMDYTSTLRRWARRAAVPLDIDPSITANGKTS
jgi:glycerol-3-phosphate dehydrogenase